MRDTPADINAMMFAGLMSLSGQERMEMGCSMFESAKEMIFASLPPGLTKAERKRALYERVYGEPLPEGCWERLLSLEGEGRLPKKFASHSRPPRTPRPPG